ncbi:MAG TPA: PIN domain-containing protein [Phycisphaerae bacterium]|nr:PIN domain-containing protein [Phycisphaerae bacterium]
MKQVFLDSVGLIALWDLHDQWHDTSRQTFDLLLPSRATLVTTELVLFETGNALSRTSFRHVVNDFRTALLHAHNLLVASDSEIDRAWTHYVRGDASAAGIVDHISFPVMRRRRIVDAFTNDRRFKVAGFTTLF